MEALVIDAGNTRISCAAWDGDLQRPRLADGSMQQLVPPVPLRELGSFSGVASASGDDDLSGSVRRLCEEAGFPPVVLVSVIPGVADLLPDGIELEVVDHTSALPFELDVVDPGLVGPDRLCNVAAAAAAGLTSALVVDAGTATTFDMLIDGVFVGGLIAPGMAFAARQLGEAASRLSPVPFGPVSYQVGRDTRSAMAAGSWHAGTGGVISVVDGLCLRYGRLPVVVTGGLGRHFPESGWYHDPDWTLRGAAILSNRCS